MQEKSDFLFALRWVERGNGKSKPDFQPYTCALPWSLLSTPRLRTTRRKIKQHVQRSLHHNLNFKSSACAYWFYGCEHNHRRSSSRTVCEIHWGLVLIISALSHRNPIRHKFQFRMKNHRKNLNAWIETCLGKNKSILKTSRACSATYQWTLSHRELYVEISLCSVHKQLVAWSQSRTITILFICSVWPNFRRFCKKSQQNKPITWTISTDHSLDQIAIKWTFHFQKSQVKR